MSGFPLPSTNRYKRYNSKSIGGPWQLLTRLVLHLLEQNVFSLFARESIERVCAMGLQRGRWDGLKNKKSTNYRNRADKEAKIMMRVSQGCTHIYTHTHTHTHTHTYFLCMCAFNLTSFMFPFFFFFFSFLDDRNTSGAFSSQTLSARHREEKPQHDPVWPDYLVTTSS